jgi:hypothetical protein
MGRRGRRRNGHDFAVERLGVTWRVQMGRWIWVLGLVAACERKPPDGEESTGEIGDDPTTECDGPEIPYNDVDEDCDPQTPDDDLDGDGHDVDSDCDDEDPDVGGPEVPYDGIDQDCDPATPDDDLDGDGSPIADDCDDEDAAILPGEVDIARDGVDQDCTGSDRCAQPFVTTEFFEFEGPTAVDEMIALCADYPDGLTVEYVFDVSESTSTDLSELSCLCEVRSLLVVASNPDLVSIEGLANVNELGGSVYIYDNPQLASLMGLRTLVSTGYGSADFANSFNLSAPALTSLAGLENLEEARHLSISLTSVPTLAGLESLSRVGHFAITYNLALESLDGLSGLSRVGDGSGENGILWVYGNPLLTSLDGLGVVEIELAFYLYSNPLLSDVTALSSLTRVSGEMLLADNPVLTGFAGLESLTAVDGTLEIDANDVLVDLTGLGALELVGGDLVVTDNPLLPEDAVETFTTGIDQIGGAIVVSGNGG